MGDPSNLLVLLVYLQGAAVIFRLGQHHHRGPFCEGRGLTHALTDTAPTDLTVAAGVGEEAHSRQPHWCPWSKPVNVETWGHVSGPIVMAHALAELRYGIVAHQYESGFKCGYISAQTLYPRMAGPAAVLCRIKTSLTTSGPSKNLKGDSEATHN